MKYFFMLAFVLATVGYLAETRSPFLEPTQVGLLTVDSSEYTSEGDSILNSWREALLEEGVAFSVISDSFWLRKWRWTKHSPKMLIVPDGIHLIHNSFLLSHLKTWVQSGGILLISGDALTERKIDTLIADDFFSNTIGIKFSREANTRLLEKDSIEVQVTSEQRQLFEFPPGTLSPEEWEKQNSQQTSTFKVYGYERASFANFVAQINPNSKTQVLLESVDRKPIFTRTALNKGVVLYSSLPLGQLRIRTQGLLQHLFLTYAINHAGRLPHLSATPQGKGVLTMNVHVDSNASIEPLKKLLAAGFFNSNPYSVSVTAGPDSRTLGDGLGFNVRENKTSRELLEELIKRGHEIGSHGGWVHDYFGLNINEKNQRDFQKFLELNKSALEEVTHHAQTEYSAPVGNHPRWVTNWLEKTGHLAYYYTGDMGMGPIREIDNQESYLHQKIWAFPVAYYWPSASLEEAQKNNRSPETMLVWLKELTRYTINNSEARMIYFHPTGMLNYSDVLVSWIKENAQLEHFQWMTMSQLANFMNRKIKTQIESTAEGSSVRIHLSNPDGLQEISFEIPTDVYVIQNQNAFNIQSHGNSSILTFQNEKSADIVITARENEAQ